MKVIELLQQITMEGFTYLPGKWEVAEGNDAGEGQITAKRAQKLLDDYPGEVAEVYEVKVKPDSVLTSDDSLVTRELKTSVQTKRSKQKG